MTSGAGAAAGDRDRALRGVRAAASARNGVKREMAAPSSSGVGQPLAAPGVQRPIEKPRRVGKYHHPGGGMRVFAEKEAKHSGWDRDCLQHTSTDARKRERGKLSDHLSERYKEDFIRVNVAQGKGRPKANNISAAKKTVKMIAERVLLSLEARATQVMFKEILDIREQTEKELKRLRQIDECGTENPKLTYDEIRAIAREKLRAREREREISAAVTQGEANGTTEPGAVETLDATTEQDEEAVEIEMMKQAIVEMRADEASKGFSPALINQKWVEKLTAACKKLLAETYSQQYVPRTRVMGCKHFTRKNRVLMACCGTFPVCRMCHFQDPNRIHDIKIEPVQTMLCMLCGEVQSKTQFCRNCKVCFGQYYCDICGITDDTPDYDLRHCDKCNVCMPGLTFHCDLCKSCVPYTHDHYPAYHGILHAVPPQHSGSNASAGIPMHSASNAGGSIAMPIAAGGGSAPMAGPSSMQAGPSLPGPSMPGPSLPSVQAVAFDPPSDGLDGQHSHRARQFTTPTL